MDNLVSPTLGTQPDPLTSQLHVCGIYGAVDDLHLSTFGTTAPRTDCLTPSPAIGFRLPKAYHYLAWLLLPFASMVLCITYVASVYLNSPIESFAQTFISNTVFSYAILAGMSLSSFVLDRSARMTIGLCIALMSLSALILVLEDGDLVYYGSKYLWRTGVLPTGPSICKQRLEDKQHILLETEYYTAQFARAVIRNGSEQDSSLVFLAFNETRFLEIHNNADICYQGFEGNQDLYGLGVRVGIYLQWIAALITNNFLPAARQVSRGAWLTFSTALCILAFVASTTDYCVFGIEIEILYWTYWGGFACVCASAPSETRLGRQERWDDLDWGSVIGYTMHTTMACHGLWFSWWGYDQVFARMPCGTYQFVFGKLLDPSNPYSYTRDVLSGVLSIIETSLFAGIPVAIVFIAVEVKLAIGNSIVPRILFRSGTSRTVWWGRQGIQGGNERISNSNGREHRTASLLVQMRDTFIEEARIRNNFVRYLVGLPEHYRGSIRLFTQEDVRHRLYHRICCLIVWLTSFSISATAIETTLAWNRVTSVHSLTSLGQIISLIIGMATVISVLWKLFKQELKRSQDTKRREIATDDVELDTSPPLPVTSSGDIHSAFRQPEEGFRTNVAALPHLTTDIRFSDAVADNDPYTMSGGAGPGSQHTDTASEIASLTPTLGDSN